MRAGPTDEVLAGTPLWSCRVSSWLGGQLLAATIPVSGGRYSAKADQDVPEKLSMTVPRFAPAVDGGDVFDWRPTSTGHPLARFGQQLDITIIVESSTTGDVWETRVGRVIITDWTDDDLGTITVTGEGMLGAIRDAKLLAPTTPSGTLTTEAQRLLPAGMGVSFDAALVDRACPTSMSWSEDRLGAFHDIANAWPALLRTDEWGQVVFRAPLPTVPVPVLKLTDGENGTVVAAPRSDTRKDAYNTVIATSSASGSNADIRGIAQITSGPMSVNGPYFPVVMKYSSPLIDSQATANAAARTMLDNSTRPAQSVPVSLAPDPRVDLDDAVEIDRGTDQPLWGWVTGYDLPLTAMDGAMRIDVGVPA